MAQIENPRKEFNFRVTVVGWPINQWLVQKITIPELSIDITEHGDTNHDIKTGGRVKISSLKMEKIMTTDPEGDTTLYNWITSVQSITAGGGLPPSAYKHTIIIDEVNELGSGVLNTWTAHKIWPHKINEMELSRLSSDNTMEVCEFALDDLIKV